MTQTVSAVYQASFDAQVKQAYQGTTVLLDCVRRRTGIVGNTHDFRKMAKVSMNARGALSSDLIPAGAVHTKVTATISDHYVADYVDIFSKPKINFDEERELVMSQAMAVGRQADQIIIDAMVASNSTNNVDEDFGATDSGLTIAKLRRAKRFLDQQGVPMGDRYFAHGARGLEDLLGTTEATSADFNSVRALVNGEIDTFLGFKFKMIEDRSEGGLPIASNIRSNFAFHGGALGGVGYASNELDVNTSIDWVAHKASYQVLSTLSAGAVTIDTDGVIEVQSFEA